MAKNKTPMGLVEKIKNFVETAEAEAADFEEKGVNAAGKRLREALKDIIDNAKAGRKLVSEIKAERKEAKNKGKKKDKDKDKKKDKKKK